jgi:signal transduction histidine kinase
MRIGPRIVLVLVLSLVAAGSAAVVVNIVALQQSPFPTWETYRDGLLEELEVSRDGVIRHVQEHPEELFTAPGDRSSWNGVTLDEASESVQRRAIRHSVERSRNLTALVIGVVAAGALAAGWLLARRILRPIRRITEQARVASVINPGVRFALEGPRDELKELADTFDEMLERISRSYGAQRRFAGQVSHELRSPLATTCSEVELLLSDVDDPGVRRRLEAIAEATRRADRLVAQLLTLARTEAGDLDWTTFELDDLVGNVLARAVESAPWAGLQLDVDLQRASVFGDRALLETLVRNLIDNAGRHNRAAGWVALQVHEAPGEQGTVFEVRNSLARGAERTDWAGPPSRPGIGLSIVTAVLEAHDGTIEWDYGDESVTVRVCVPSGTSGSAATRCGREIAVTS